MPANVSIPSVVLLLIIIQASWQKSVPGNQADCDPVLIVRCKAPVRPMVILGDYARIFLYTKVERT